MAGNRPREDERRCMFCGHDERLELQRSTVEPGMWICSDLDRCYLRLLVRREAERSVYDWHG